MIKIVIKPTSSISEELKVLVFWNFRAEEESRGWVQTIDVGRAERSSNSPQSVEMRAGGVAAYFLSWGQVLGYRVFRRTAWPDCPGSPDSGPGVHPDAWRNLLLSCPLPWAFCARSGRQGLIMVPHGLALVCMTQLHQCPSRAVTCPRGVEASVEDGVLPPVMALLFLSQRDRDYSQLGIMLAGMNWTCSVSFAQSIVLKYFK